MSEEIKKEETKEEETVEDEVVEEEPKKKEEESEETKEEPEKKEEEPEEDEDEDLPEKFKGKSKKDIAQSYIELEKLIGSKGGGITEEKKEELRDRGFTEKNIKDLEGIKKELDKVDFNTVDPRQFFGWAFEQMANIATNRAQKVFDESSKVKESVRKEIHEAEKEYPILKENNKFRNMVKSLIKSERADGNEITLIEACKQVAELINYKKPTEINRKAKQADLAIEGGDSGLESEKDTEEERIKKGMIGGGKVGAFGGII